MWELFIRLFLLVVFFLLLVGGNVSFAAGTTQLLEALRDPAGVPFYPVVMQVLQVITFALHITFVYTSVGGLLVALFGFTRKDERWQRLAQASLVLAKVSVSLAIVLAVAPLLFYQIIYDSLWYASANLSAAWYVMSIVLLLIGYYSTWGAYFMKQKPTVATVLTFLGVVFLLWVGFIIHVVNYQALYPEKWVAWYTNGGTTMNTSGWNIYAFNIFRYVAFLVAPALSFTGIFLMLYGRYFRGREDMDQSYLEWASHVGAKLALPSAAVWLLSYFLYVLSIPSDWNAKGSIFTLLGGMGIILTLGVLFVSMKNPVKMALPSLVAGGVAIILISVFREYLRLASTAPFGYSPYNHKLNLELLSPLLFFGTLATGLILYAYAWWMAYKAGKVPKGKVVEATETERHLGDLSVFVVTPWAVVFI